ncbi:MAG: hypothetical protein Q7S21_01765 [archaeon]|nr:hypothetical protein [archaeon]
MTTKKKLLITRPRHEATVEYLYYWSSEIIKFAKDHNLSVFDCSAENANQSNVCQYLEKMAPNFVVFNGHGSDKAILGHHDEEIIRSEYNENLLKEKIVYAIACKTAAHLGKEACKNGTKAFIGYEQDFGFITDTLWEGSPTKDALQEPFKEASNTVAFSIIKGNTAKEAFEKSQKKFDDLIKKYSSTNASKENKEIRFWLFWDKIFQRIIGDENATI